MCRLMWIVWSIMAAAVGVLHLLFALANFGLGGIAIAEGIFSALAGTALIASILVFRWSRATTALVILGGSIPLTVWFAFTVPEHSDVAFFYFSLIVPGAAVLFIFLVYLSSRIRSE